MKITKKLMKSFIVWIIMFVVLTLFISNLDSSGGAGDYTDSKLNIVIFDNDCSPESKALYDYIGSRHKIKELTKTDVESVNDALFYNIVNYVLTIKEGYGEMVRGGETDGLFEYKTAPSSYYGEYMNMQLEQYISSLSAYIASGMDIAPALEKTADSLREPTEVDKVSFDNDSRLGRHIYSIMRYMPYIFLTVSAAVIARIIITLNSDDIRKRTSCAPVSMMKYNLQVMLGASVVCLSLWLFMMLYTVICSGRELFTNNGLFAVLNNFVFLIVAASLGLFISSLFGKDSEAIDMINNIVSLGMCFLGGVFVPLQFLSGTVLIISKFLPTYWYIRALDSIAGINGMTYDTSVIRISIGIQFLFAAALLAASMAVSKFRRKA